MSDFSKMSEDELLRPDVSAGEDQRGVKPPEEMSDAELLTPDAEDVSQDKSATSGDPNGRALGFFERHGIEAEAATGVRPSDAYNNPTVGKVMDLAYSVAPFTGTAARAISGRRQKSLDAALETGDAGGAFGGMDEALKEWDATEGAKHDLYQRALKGDADADYSPLYAKRFNANTGRYEVETTKDGRAMLDGRYAEPKDEARRAYVKWLAAGQIAQTAQAKENAQKDLANNTASAWMNLAHGATASLGFAGEFYLGGALAKGALGTAALAGTKLGKAAQVAEAGGKLGLKARTALASAELAAPTIANAIARYENLTKNDYRMDEDGNVVLAEQGDGAFRAGAKALGGAAFENATEVALGSVVNKVFGATCKGIYNKVPGVKKLFDGAVNKVGDRALDAAKRAWFNAARTYATVQKAVHFELMPVGEFAEEYVQGMGDDVLGFGNRADAKDKGLGEFTRDFIYWDAGGKDLFFGVMGQTIALGLGAHGMRRANDFRNSVDAKVLGTLKLRGYNAADIAKMGMNARLGLAMQLSDGKATKDMGYGVQDYADFLGIRQGEVEQFTKDMKAMADAEAFKKLSADEQKRIAANVIQFTSVLYNTASAFERGDEGVAEMMDHLNSRMRKAMMLMEERQGLGNSRNNAGTRPQDFASRIDWTGTSDAAGNINWQTDEATGRQFIESAPLAEGGNGVRIFREGDRFRVVHPQGANRNGYLADDLKTAHDYAASLDQFAQKKNADRAVMRDYVKFNAQRLVPQAKGKDGKTASAPAPIVTANNAQDALDNLDWLTDGDRRELQNAMLDGTDGGALKLEDGTVLVLIDNLRDTQDALLTLAHELGGHAALAEGTKANGLSLADTVAEVYKTSANKDEKQAATEYGIRRSEGADKQTARAIAQEEGMVYGNEYRMPVASPLQKAKTAVKVWMKQHGMDAKLTDADYDAIAAAGLSRIRSTQTRTGDTGTDAVDGNGINVTPTVQGTDLQNRYNNAKWVSDYYSQREKLEAARAALDAAEAAKRIADEATKEQAKIEQMVKDEDERQRIIAEQEQMRKDAEHATKYGREMVRDVLTGWYSSKNIKPEQVERIVNGATDAEIAELLDFIELEMDGKAGDGSVLEVAKGINAAIARRTVSEKQAAQRKAFAERTAKERKERIAAENKLISKFVNEVQMNPHSALAFWMENGHRLFSYPQYRRVANKGKGAGFRFEFVGADSSIDALNNFFNGIHGTRKGDERERLIRLVFGENAKPGEGDGDVAMDNWIGFKHRGAETAASGQKNGLTNEELMADEDWGRAENLLNRFMDEYAAYEEWKNGDQLTAEERRTADAIAADNARMDEENAAIAEAEENWGGAIAMTADGRPVKSVADVNIGDGVEIGGEYLRVVKSDGDMVELDADDGFGIKWTFRFNKENGGWEYVETQDAADEGGQDRDRTEDRGDAERDGSEGREDGDDGAVGGEGGGNGAAAEAPSAGTEGKVETDSGVFTRLEERFYKQGDSVVGTDSENVLNADKDAAMVLFSEWSSKLDYAVESEKRAIESVRKFDFGDRSFADIPSANPEMAIGLIRDEIAKKEALFNYFLASEKKIGTESAKSKSIIARKFIASTIVKMEKAISKIRDLIEEDKKIRSSSKSNLKLDSTTAHGSSAKAPSVPAHFLNLDKNAIEQANAVSFHDSGNILADEAQSVYQRGLESLADRDGWTEQEREQAKIERANWKKLVEDAYNDMLRKRGNWVSPMVAGPSKYNQKKWDKRYEAMLSAGNEWQEKIRSFDEAAKKRIAAAAPADVQVQRIKDNGLKRGEAISAGDENAVAKLKAKAENIRRNHAQNIAMNAWWRKHGTMVGFGELGEEQAKRMDAAIKSAPSFAQTPAPSYVLSGETAELKRIERRIEDLKRNAEQAQAAEPQKHPWGEVIENADENRLQVDFGGEKPPQGVIDLMKRNGFKWSPKNGVWQRQLTDNARSAMKRIAPELDEAFGAGAEGMGGKPSLALEAATADEIAAEERRIRDRKEIERRQAAPLKTGNGEVGQSLMDLGGAEGEDLFNRTKWRRTPKGEEPKKTAKVYKLMRLVLDRNGNPRIGENGKPLLQTLYIGREDYEVGQWYDGEVPNIGKVLADEPTGYAYLIDGDDKIVERKPVKGGGAKISGLPSKDDVLFANSANARWITKTENAKGNPTYANVGINGSEGVTTFAMRPGIHAGSLPSMQQIGVGEKRNLRADNLVWVRGRVDYDPQYESVVKSEGGEINDRMPEHGYVKGSSSFVTKGMAWYISPKFIADEIISDQEAERVMDEFNRTRDADGEDVGYDYPRANDRRFYADTMKIEPRRKGDTTDHTKHNVSAQMKKNGERWNADMTVGVPKSLIPKVKDAEGKAQGRWRRTITPAEDAAYMDAVKRGDMEAARRMVREAAAKNGYGIAGFHGTLLTGSPFNVFSRKAGIFGDRKKPDYENLGFHFGDKESAQARIDWLSEDMQVNGNKHIYEVFLRLSNPLRVPDNFGSNLSIQVDGMIEANKDNKELVASLEKLLADAEKSRMSVKKQFSEVERIVRGFGYDGFVYSNDSESDGKDSYVAFSPSQIKSADPVTYDDAGNVIPLSRRFDGTSDDIRFRRRAYSQNLPAQSLADQRIRSLTDALRESKFGADSAALFAAEKMARELAQQGSIDPALRDLIERTQTGSAADRAKGNAAALLSPQNLSRWRELMQDSLISLRELEDRLGVKKDTSVYHQFDRNYGLVAKAADDLDREIVTPLAKELKDNGIPLADFSMLLQALHGPERNRMIAERSPYVRAALDNAASAPYVTALLAGNIDIDEAQIDEICKRLGWLDKNGVRTKQGRQFAKDLAGSGATTAFWNGKVDAFRASGMLAKAQKAIRLVRRLTRRNRALLVATGRMSRAQASLWAKLSPNYVPLRSDMEMDTNVWSKWLLGGGADKGGANGKRYSDNEYNHAYGRGTLADNPLEFALQQYQESLQRAYDNVARRRLAEIVRNNPALGKVFRYEPLMTPTKRAHYAKEIAIIRNMAKAGTATAADVRKLHWYEEAFNADTAIPTIRVLGANGVVHEMPNLAGLEGTKDKPTGVIAFKEDGELKFIRLGGFDQADVSADPSLLDDVAARRIATAVKKQNMAQLNGFGRAMRKATGIFSALRTAYSPTFLISNLGADNTQAARNIYATFGVKAVGKFEHYAAHAFKAAQAVVTGRFDNTKIQQYAQEWYENGGKIGGMATASISDLTNDIKRTMRQLNSQKQQLASIQSFGDLVRWMADRKDQFEKFAEHWNGVIEMSTRIAAYATARDMGQSIEDAVSYSRDITVNFNRKGTITPWTNALYAFSNATMQDLHRSLVAFGEGNYAKGSGILAKRGAVMGFDLMMMGFLASVFGFWQDDDKDEQEGKAQWKYAKDWEKQNTLGVRIGEKTYGVPIRGISRVPYYLGHQMWEAMSGRKGVAKAAIDTATLALSNVGDFMGQASSPLMTSVPSLARDPIDIFISNRTFTGRQRYREPLPGQEQTSVRSEMGRRDTSDAAKAVARALNWMTGGDEKKRGLIDVQPEKVQGVWEWLFGSAGKDISNIVGTAKDAATLNLGNRDIRNIPYLSRFARNLSENSADYYEARSRYEQAKKHYNGMNELGREDEMRRDAAEHPWLSSRGSGRRWGEELKDLDGAVKKLMEMEKAASTEDYDAIHGLRLKTQYQFMRRLETAPADDAEGVTAEKEHRRALAPLLRSSRRADNVEQREMKKRKRLF